MLPFTLVAFAVIAVGAFVYDRSKYSWSAHKLRSFVVNDVFEVALSLDGGLAIINSPYKSLCLTFNNRSPDDLVIDWENTYYIFGDETKDGFAFADQSLEIQINRQRKSDLVFPKLTAQRHLIPLVNIQKYELPSAGRFMSPRTHISANNLGEGKHGVSVLLRQGDKEWRETLMISIEKVRA